MSDAGQASLFGSEPRPDGRSAATAISVSALNHATERLLEERVPRLWVRGEISKWTVARSGHRYFTLRDDGAQVDCVLFQGDAWRLPTDPDEGTEIAALGQPTLFARAGRFQLRVQKVEAAGDGLWRLAFERLRQTLEAEGLLAPERKRRLPAFPLTIGVVTSRGGAALRDVIAVLRRRSPWVDIVVHDCRVQGEGAAMAVRDALERLASWPSLDAIILTRGGGSTEDLWCFNEEVAVRAVAACRVPVICAIGHEVDVTLAELVADVRAATPTEAAERAAPDAAEVRGRLERVAGGLARGLRRGVSRGRERFEVFEDRLPRAAGLVVRDARGRLRAVEERLPRAAGRAVEASRGRLGAVAGRLDALSPFKTLARGYAVATRPDGTVLSRAAEASPGDPLRLRLREGELDATVDEVRA